MATLCDTDLNHGPLICGVAWGQGVGERQASRSKGTAPRRESPAWRTAIGRQRFAAVAAWAAVGLATAFVTVTVVSHGSPPGPSTASRHPGGQGAAGQSAGAPPATATQIRTQAAVWMARQLSPGTTVACDPQMCSALRAAGLQASRLLVLRPPARGRLAAGIVVRPGPCATNSAPGWPAPMHLS